MELSFCGILTMGLTKFFQKFLCCEHGSLGLEKVQWRKQWSQMLRQTDMDGFQESNIPTEESFRRGKNEQNSRSGMGRKDVVLLL